MLLDNRTLLFSLTLVCATMAFSLAVVSWGREHDSLKRWGGALALESLGWALGAVRGEIPDLFTVLIYGVLIVSAQSMKLAAIHEFHQKPWPRWQCLLPVALAFLMLAVLPYADFRSRIVCGSLIFSAQMLMILRALLEDQESRAGRAWWLLFGASAVMLPMFALRGTAAFFNLVEFADVQSSIAPNPLQLTVFVGLIAMSLLGSLGFILMVKERADRAIRAMAMTDSLTGVFNRRALMERAEREYAISQRNKTTLALLMLDIDHFKRINDRHGHPAGDAVLVEVARLLNSRLRKQDTLGRYGGEEFCILLPATDAAGAMAVAESLRSSVECTPFSVGGGQLALSISVGVTLCTADCSNCNGGLGSLFDDADAALYRAKNDGRNRCIMLPVSCRAQAGEAENNRQHFIELPVTG